MIKHRIKYVANSFHIKKIVCLLMTCAIAFCGCGKDMAQPAPELIDTAVVESSYTSVEYGEIGTTIIEFGKIVPRPINHFWDSNVKVRDIKVKVGDYVKAGQTLAVADVNYLRKDIEKLEGEIAFLNSQRELNEKIYGINHTNILYMYDTAYKGNDKKTAAVYKEQADDLEEKNIFDGKLHDLKIRNLLEDIEKDKRLMNNSTLVATKSGYVTYIKDIAASDEAMIGENVVVISDYDDLYVEFPKENIRSSYLKMYDQFYTTDGDEYYELEYYPYTPQEKSVCEKKNMLPAIRFKYKDPSKMPAMGTSIPIIMQKNVDKNVLLVQRNAVNEDMTGHYVYVKEGDKRVQRYIEIGRNDVKHYEVLSGLSEGEIVYTSVASVLPTDYILYPVRTDQYAETLNSIGYEIVNTERKPVYSDVEGFVEEIYVPNGSEVKKGDKLFRIKTDNGQARLTEILLEMQNLSNRYENYKKSAEKQISELNKSIEENNKRLKKEAKEKEEEKKRIEELKKEIEAQKKEMEAMSLTTVSGNAMFPMMGGEQMFYVPELIIPDDMKIIDYYSEDQIKREIEIINQQLELEKIVFEYTYKNLSDEYEKISKNNLGDGNVIITAPYSGMIATMDIKLNEKVQESTKVCTLKVEGEQMITILSKLTLPLGLEMDIYNKTLEKTYHGTLIGDTGACVEGNPRVYVNTINDAVYVTSAPTGGNAGKVLFKFDDEVIKGKDQEVSVKIDIMTISKIMVVPRLAVRSEIDPVRNQQLEFVYVMRDGIMCKQYITTFGAANAELICVFSGLKIGDQVVVENIGKEY